MVGGARISTAAPRFDIVDPTTAEVLGSTVGFEREYPLVTVNEFGAGRAVYVGIPARREVLDLVLGAEIERLGLHTGPVVPTGVMARQVDDRHVLYLNLDAEPKPIELQGKATSVLNDTRYDGGFTLGAYDAEFVELDAG